MTKTAIEILSLGVSLAALLGTVVVVDWPLIRAWWANRKFRRTLAGWERSPEAQAADQREFEAQREVLTLKRFLERIQPQEAAHPMDDEPYDISKPMPLPEPWQSIPPELRAVCYHDTQIKND